MEYFYIALIVILLSISIGLFFNYLINSTEKRIPTKKILIVGCLLGFCISLFFYWQQMMNS